MRGRLDPAEVQRRLAALRAIGLTDQALRDVMAKATRGERLAAKAELVARLKPAYRARVRLLHPDLNQGDQAKAEELRALVAGWQDVEAWQPPDPQPQVQRVVWVTPGFTFTSSTATTTNGAWGSYWTEPVSWRNKPGDDS